MGQWDAGSESPAHQALLCELLEELESNLRKQHNNGNTLTWDINTNTDLVAEVRVHSACWIRRPLWKGETTRGPGASLLRFACPTHNPFAKCYETKLMG